MSKYSVKVIGRVVTVTSGVEPENVHTGNICVSGEQLSQVNKSDTVIVVATDKFSGNLLGKKTYQPGRFHDSLKQRNYLRDGRPFRFVTISYR